MIFSRARSGLSIFLVMVGTLVTVSLASASRLSPANATTAQPGFFLSQASDDQVSIEILPPALTQSPIEIEGEIYQQLEMKGYGNTAEPGLPNVPSTSFYLALPPGAEPVLEVISSEGIQLANLTIAPSRQMTLEAYDDPSFQTVPAFESSYPLDEPAYRQAAFYPGQVAALRQVTQLRDVRLAQIDVFPVQVAASLNELVSHSRIALQVTFTYPNGKVDAAAPRPESAAFERILQHHILNYDQSLSWRQAPQQGAVTPMKSPCMTGTAFRVMVDNSGIHQLTYNDLVAAGLSGPVPNSNLQMCSGNAPIDIQIEDQSLDNQFGSGDSIIFYGEAIKTDETDTNVYWLTVSGGAGSPARMNTKAGNPAGGTQPTSHPVTMHLEQDLDYKQRYPATDFNDHWYWKLLSSSNDPSLTINFSTSNLSGLAHTVTITTEVWGYEEVQTHPYEIYLNNQLIGSDSFTGSGKSEVEGTGWSQLVIQVNSSQLNAGSNTLRVTALPQGGTHHAMLVNRAEVAYQRTYAAQNNRLAFHQTTAGSWEYHLTSFSQAAAIYNVSDPAQPEIITTNAPGPGNVTFQETLVAPASYVATSASARLTPVAVVKDTPSNLAATSNRADYIIITDPYFSAALSPLAAHRLQDPEISSVKTVYVQDIFDEFSYGLYDTDALRRFLEYTYSEWQSPAPSYVLLAGEGTYDHRDLLGLNGAYGNLVPVYLKDGVDPYLGETAADNQYVSFLGNDDIADMLLGRLPAESLAEMNAMVNKIIAHDNQSFDPGWQSRHIYLVDNGFKNVGPPSSPVCEQDAAGDFFYYVNNAIADFFPRPPNFPARIYYAPETCYPRPGYESYENYYANSVDATQTRFLTAYNLGSRFVTYTGHSSITQYGEEGFVGMGSIDNMLNGSRTTISLPMTCLSGLYHWTNLTSLEEAMLKKTSGGSVAAYAPTGLQVHTGHDYLLYGFYGEMFAGAGTLGEAIMGAKLNLNGSTGSYQDLQDTYMLLGDPAMSLNVWNADSAIHLPSLFN